jgi:hypothetical protein
MLRNKLSVVILTAVTSITTSIAAQAFEFAGATLSLEARDAGDFGSQNHFTGGVELSFGSGLGTQLSIKNTNYNSGSGEDFGARGHELHLIWRPQVEGLALGVFCGEEDFDPWFTYHGIEAKYEVSGFSIEAAALDYAGPSYDARHLTLELGYQINDRFAVYVGHSDADDAFGFQASNTYVGGSAKLAQGFSLYGHYGESDEGGSRFDVVTLGVRYDLGEGVTFRQRSYNELFPID